MKDNIRFFFCVFIFLLFEFGISSCNSSNKNFNQDKDTSKIIKKVPSKVNSANVEAEILNYESEHDYINFIIKIIEVRSYGASIPPLPTGTIIKAEVTNSSFEKNISLKEKLLHTGAKYNIMMEHFNVPAGSASPSWRIISIE